jgi:hypothetical protein
MDQWCDAATLKLFPEELPAGDFPPGTRAFWFRHSKVAYRMYVTHVIRGEDGNAKLINLNHAFTGGSLKPHRPGEPRGTSHIIVLPGGYIDPTFLP